MIGTAGVARLAGVAVAGVLLAGAGAAAAQDGVIAIGPRVGTTGPGVEAQFSLTSFVVLRAGADSLAFDGDIEGEDLEYGGDFDFTTATAAIDIHPFGGAFFISAGAVFGDRNAGLEATGTGGSVEVGNDTFTAAEVGTLRGDVDLGSPAAFVGLGWDNTFTGQRRWGLRFLIGAQIADSPSVTLARVAGAPLSPAVEARLNAELQNEARRLEEDADGLSIYPVVQIGLNFRF